MTCYSSRAFIIHWLRFCALKTLRRETSKLPNFRRHFWQRYQQYSKTKGATTCYTSRAFMWYTFCLCSLKTLGEVTRIKSRETVKWPIFRRHFWRRYWRYQRTKGAMTCYSSRAFMRYTFCWCPLKTLGGVTRIKSRETAKMAHFQTPFLTKILMISKNWGCHDMLLIKGFHVI